MYAVRFHKDISATLKNEFRSNIKCIIVQFKCQIINSWIWIWIFAIRSVFKLTVYDILHNLSWLHRLLTVFFCCLYNSNQPRNPTNYTQAATIRKGFSNWLIYFEKTFIHFIYNIYISTAFKKHFLVFIKSFGESFNRVNNKCLLLLIKKIVES